MCKIESGRRDRRTLGVPLLQCPASRGECDRGGGAGSRWDNLELGRSKVFEGVCSSESGLLVAHFASGTGDFAGGGDNL